MARILWVSVETPDRDGQGGQRRQFHQIQALIGRGHEITVLAPHSAQSDATIRAIATTTRPKLTRFGRLNARRVREVRETITAPGWDAIVASHHETWWLLAGRPDDSVPTLVDVHNVFSHWHRTTGRADEAAAATRLEDEVVRGATAITTCSDTELRRLVSIHPAAREKTFAAPLGVDAREWPDQRFDRTEAIVALFGSWDWEPNALGLTWFLGEVWPRVRAGFPDAVARVAGSGVTDQRSWPAGTEFVGRVGDLADFCATATVVAVPVIDGVGASVKFAEALASGGAVIATPDGANAFEDPPARVSADASEWADWIIARLRNRHEEPAPAASRSIALRDYDWNAAVAPIDRWLGEVAANPRGPRDGRVPA